MPRLQQTNHNHSTASNPSSRSSSRSPLPFSSPNGNRSTVVDPIALQRAVDEAKLASMKPDLIQALQSLAQHTRGCTLRPNQVRALCGILNIPQNNRKSLIIQRTGAGKTIIVQTLAAALKGVTLIISPLLALTANLASRFTSGNIVDGAVDAIHLDEDIGSDEKLQQLVIDIDNKLSSTNNTTIILCSPQFIVRNSTLKDSLLRAIDRRVLRAIICDECHLLAQHGADFRDTIRAFGRLFLHPAINHTAAPYFIGLTGTLSFFNLCSLQNLLGTSISPYGILRDSWGEFKQRNINMSFKCSSKYKVEASNLVTSFFTGKCKALHAYSKSGAVVFVNSRSLLREVNDSMEHSLDKHDCGHIDIATVHGHMPKEEKFFSLHTFCSNEVIEEYDCSSVRCFISTSASDHGIDHKLLCFEVICEWPENISVFIQRRGRLVRQEIGEEGEILVGDCVLVAGLDNFIYLYIRAALGQYNSPVDDDNSTQGWEGTNTIFSPQNIQSNIDKADELNTRQLKWVSTSKCNDLLDMARLVCLDEGCWHLRLEFYCQNGVYTPAPVECLDVCRTMCPICRRTDFNSTIRRIDKDALKAFLASGYVRDSFPLPATDSVLMDKKTNHKINIEPLVDLVWKNKAIVTNIFDVKHTTVKRYNIEMMWLSLLCKNIIELIVERDGSAKFIIGRVLHSSSPYPIECYNIDEYWNGINVFNYSNKGRAHKQTTINIS